MKKLDKAVEIIRNMSDEELRKFIIEYHCPHHHIFGMEECQGCYDTAKDCKRGWNEEVSE